MVEACCFGPHSGNPKSQIPLGLGTQPFSRFYRNIKAEMADRVYSEEEAQEILRLATQRATSEGGMTRDRLIQAAAEMGIDSAEIIAAEQELLTVQSKRNLRARYIEVCKREFNGSVSNLVSMSILLFGINYLCGGFHSIWTTWAIWPCGFMALNTLKDGWEYVSSKTSIGDEEFEEWCEDQMNKEQVGQWLTAHPGFDSAAGAARQAFSEFGPDHKLSAIKRTRELTGLGSAEAKELVDAVAREQMFGTIASAPVNASTIEVARQALSEVGPDRKFEAIDLVRARTGVGLDEATDVVQAVSELSH